MLFFKPSEILYGFYSVSPLDCQSGIRQRNNPLRSLQPEDHFSIKGVHIFRMENRFRGLCEDLCGLCIFIPVAFS